MARLQAPLLVVHGTADRTIPIDQGREMLRRAGSATKRPCEAAGAGHNDLDILRAPAVRCIEAFVDEVSGSRGRPPQGYVILENAYVSG